MPLSDADIAEIQALQLVGQMPLTIGEFNLNRTVNDLGVTVQRLSKLVHILWKEVESLERFVKVIPEGLQIKAGFSEILVLKNGGIRIGGQRVLLTSPGKSEFYF